MDEDNQDTAGKLLDGVNSRTTLHSSLGAALSGVSHHVVAFVKEDPESMPGPQQMQLISQYCGEHGLEISQLVEYAGSADTNLDAAVQQLSAADVLIVSDLQRLDHGNNDDGGQVKTFLRQFVGSDWKKRFVSISEGIDTRTPAGQTAALSYINQGNDQGLQPDDLQFVEDAQ